MSDEQVWVSHGDGKSPVLTPRAEVPGNYLLGTLQGFGPCWFDPAKLKGRPDPVHDPFPEAVRTRLRRITTAFSYVRPLTLEAWEDGFRCDAHPWGEIALWELAADVYTRATKQVHGADKRKGIFLFIVALMNRGMEGRIRLSGEAASVAGGRREQILADFDNPENTALTTRRRNELRSLIAPHVLQGPGRVSLESLFDESGTSANLAADFAPRELIESADVILGVNVADAHEFVLYGRDRLQEITSGNSGEGAQLAVLRIEMDQQTDDLERAVVLMEVLKGRHDYSGGSVP